MSEILEKMFAIQQELKCPKALRNDFGGYNYRSLESILEAAKPVLQKNGCTLRITDEPVLIGERYYIKATATLKDVEMGNEISVCGYAREPVAKKGMDESQLTGAASSYARKYALNGLFLLDDAKDADDPEVQKATVETQRRGPAPVEKLKLVLKDLGIPAAFVAKAYGVEYIEKLTDRQCESLMSAEGKKKLESAYRKEIEG